MSIDLPEMAYITRMDYEKTATGWWVRFGAAHKSKSKLAAQRFFKDKDYLDGKEEALFFAQEYRDYKCAELIDQGTIKGYRDINGNGIPPVYRDTNTKNKSGIVGVEQNDFLYQKNVLGTLYTIHCFVWKATWVEYDVFEGELRRRKRARSFSITRWGEDVALEKAVNCRKKMETYLLSERHVRVRNKYMIEDRKKKSGYE